MFLTIEHVPRITDFCSCIYVLGCRLSFVRLCDSDFGITPVDDITIGITCAAFCFHIAQISLASSWYLFCLSVIIIIIIIIIIFPYWPNMHRAYLLSIRRTSELYWTLFNCLILYASCIIPTNNYNK